MYPHATAITIKNHTLEYRKFRIIGEKATAIPYRIVKYITGGRK